jgi:hypothetical protein
VLISNAVYESDDGRLWNDNDEVRNVRRVRKMKTLAMKMETLNIDTDWYSR